MMTEAIVVALIAAGASVLCQVLLARKSTALMQYRMDQLEDKVKKHNNFMERLVCVERDVKTAFRLIEESKRGGY